MSSTMKLKFKASPAQHPGGERYEVGRWYFLGREETCLWIHRDVVDLGSMEPANLTPRAIEENTRNFLPGRALTLGEIVAALNSLRQGSPA
jgi:hypothetical protein